VVKARHSSPLLLIGWITRSRTSKSRILRSETSMPKILTSKTSRSMILRSETFGAKILRSRTFASASLNHPMLQHRLSNNHQPPRAIPSISNVSDIYIFVYLHFTCTFCRYFVALNFSLTHVSLAHALEPQCNRARSHITSARVLLRWGKEAFLSFLLLVRLSERYL